MARDNAVQNVIGQVFTKACDCDAFDHNNNSVCLIIPVVMWQLSYAGYVRVLLIVLISVFPAPGLVRKLWGRRIRRQEKKTSSYIKTSRGEFGADLLPASVFLPMNPTI